MIKKRVIDEKRIRRIDGSFSFIPHRFVTDGFLASLQPNQLLLYLFLTIVADRQGLSFYSYDRICTLLGMTLEEYIQSRNALMESDLIAFDGTLYQVLELPAKSVPTPKSKIERLPGDGPVSLGQILRQMESP